MKKLITLLLLIPLLGYSQFCSTTTISNQGAITPTTSWINATVPAGFKYYWTFTATAGCTYDLSSCNSLNTNDTYLRLYSGTVPTTAVLVTSNDDFGPFCSTTKASISWLCAVGGSYSILMTDYSCANISSSTILSYRKTCPILLTNDNCINATLVTVPYNSGVTNNNSSTDDAPAVSSCGTQGSNVWYKVIGNNTTYTATTCNSNTNFDTEVRVYTGSCGSMNEVTCNDDDLICGSSVLQSTVTWCALQGVTYYISVGYWTSGVGYGNFVLSVTSGSVCSTLPIELIDFEGNLEVDKVHLKWSTASEVNNHYFSIQKYDSLGNWSELTRIEGNGTTSYTSYYSTYDYHLISGYEYYRLIQVDYNGVSKTYPPIDVYVPFSDTKVILTITDILGREINDLETFKGMYLIIYTDGSVLKSVK